MNSSSGISFPKNAACSCYSREAALAKLDGICRFCWKQLLNFAGGSLFLWSSRPSRIPQRRQVWQFLRNAFSPYPSK